MVAIRQRKGTSHCVQYRGEAHANAVSRDKKRVDERRSGSLRNSRVACRGGLGDKAHRPRRNALACGKRAIGATFIANSVVSENHIASEKRLQIDSYAELQTDRQIDLVGRRI